MEAKLQFWSMYICHNFNFVPIHLIVSIPSFNFQNQGPSIIDYVNFVLQLSKSSKFHYLTFKIKSIISLEVFLISVISLEVDFIRK